jgi:hypothetical protein
MLGLLSFRAPLSVPVAWGRARADVISLAEGLVGDPRDATMRTL